MDRTLQLTQIFELRHRNGMKIKDALISLGLSDSTFYDIPREEREAAEKEVVDHLAAEFGEMDIALKTARIEAEHAIIQTILDRMPTYIKQLDTLAMSARREDVRKAAIDTLIEIARNGVFVQPIHTSSSSRALEEIPQERAPLAPPSTMLHPTVIVFTAGPQAQTRPVDIVDGEIVERG